MPIETSATHLPIEQQDVLLQTMTSGDLQMMYGWLGAGTDKFRENEAKTLAEGLMDHQQNADKGLNRGLVLVMGFLIKRTGSWQTPEIQATLMDQLIYKLGGEQKALEVIDEGVEENGDIARITSRPKTDLGERVMEVVEQWWLSDSEQAKLSAAELALDHRQKTNDELKEKAGRLEKDLEIVAEERNEALQRRHADSEEILLLKRELEEKETGGGGEVWGNVQQKVVQEAYDKLDQQAEKSKVDALAAALLDCVPGEPLAKEVVSLLDNLFQSKLIDRVMGSSEWLKKSSLNGKDLSGETALIEAFQNLLRMKELPGSKSKNKEVELLANMAFYKEMGGVVRLRIEQIRERQNKIESLNQKSFIDLQVSHGPEKGIEVKIDEAVPALIIEAQVVSDYQLPRRRVKVELDNSTAIAVKEITLALNKGWQAGFAEFQHVSFNDEKAQTLFNALSLLNKKGVFKLTDGFQISEAENKLLLNEGESLVAEITLGEKGRIKVSWRENIGLEKGLKAMVVFGQSLNDFLAAGERFPGLHLNLTREIKKEKKAKTPVKTAPVETVAPAPTAEETPPVEEVVASVAGTEEKKAREGLDF